MPIPVPTLCRIEYWNPDRGDWGVGHSGINLLDPATYVRKATTRGTLTRAVEADSGVIHYGLEGSDLL